MKINVRIVCRYISNFNNTHVVHYMYTQLTYEVNVGLSGDDYLLIHLVE